MRTEKEIENKLKFLQELISEDTKYEEELIMGGRQRARIRVKIDLLNWVLNKDIPELKNKYEFNKISNSINPPKRK